MGCIIYDDWNAYVCLFVGTIIMLPGQVCKHMKLLSLLGFHYANCFREFVPKHELAPTPSDRCQCHQTKCIHHAIFYHIRACQHGPRNTDNCMHPSTVSLAPATVDRDEMMLPSGDDTDSDADSA